MAGQQLKPPALVQVLRGKEIESEHQIIFCLFDESGKSVLRLGPTGRRVFPRSAIKWLQALALARSGGLQKFSLTEKHLAFACASHRGEKIHIDLVSEWLRDLNLQERDLACGNEEPGNRLAHNCSGKHSGFLTTCLAEGFPTAGYHLWDHPLQEKLRNIFRETMDTDFDKRSFGVDGCGIPTYYTPMESIARGMSLFLKNPENEFKQIRDACQKFPEYVSGLSDWTYQIFKATEGRVFIKSGAEGFYSGFLWHQGLGFCFKILDGSARAAEAMTIQIVEKWGGLTSLPMPVIKNSRDEVVGEMNVVLD